MTVTFEVPGHCKPAGSKRFVTNKYTGRGYVIDANPKAADWKSDVAAVAKASFKGPLLTVALCASFEFFVPRPDCHYGSGKNVLKLKAGAPQWPAKKPDVLKLARGIEDALSGIIYRDDCQIVKEILTKDWAATKEAFIGVRVTIQTLEALPVNGEQRELIPSTEAALL